MPYNQLLSHGSHLPNCTMIETHFNPLRVRIGTLGKVRVYERSLTEAEVNAAIHGTQESTN